MRIRNVVAGSILLSCLREIIHQTGVRMPFLAIAGVLFLCAGVGSWFWTQSYFVSLALIGIGIVLIWLAVRKRKESWADDIGDVIDVASDLD